ncbi:ATP-binding protein [Actinomadura sp. NBRC 104412]|uniref:ATP-binding protein n=1 Tax=Actinomadura sp. NBRC 104412 TaxID=3032203 RepID=UPI002554EF6A|nr:ATP-binding protein [Actinomadura sp. NBRC 104412]
MSGDGAPVELAILIGLQGSGKTTFYRRHLACTHAHVSKDLFGRSARRKQQRQLRQIAEHLRAGRSVAVDNTNPSPVEWTPLIVLGREHGARITGYWFPPDLQASMRRNAARPGRDRVPDVGVLATLERLREPRYSDGFDELRVVRADGAGGFTVTVKGEERDKQKHEEKHEEEDAGDAPARP